MKPRVLLVYANPAITATPVSPYGAERIGQAFRAAGCDVRLLAPWLGFQPGRALEEALEWNPDVVGFSIRNVDDSLVVRSAEGPGDIDTTFYLPAVRRRIRQVRARGIPVIVGGAAVASMGAELLDWLDVDLGVAGPADDIAVRIGQALVHGTPLYRAVPDDPRIIRRGTPHARSRGDTPSWAPMPGSTPRMSEYLTLARERGGRIPVQISGGCDRRCTFCVEPSFLGWQATPRPVGDVVREIAALRSAGIGRIWLSASELNVPDARHATAVLDAIARAGLRVDVAGFVQVAPVDDSLLDAFEAVGVDLATLSWELGHLDDRLLRKGAGPANRGAIDALVDRYLERGIRTLGGSVLFGAHPEETLEHVDVAIAAARELDAALPNGLGLAYAAGARVYPAAPLGRWVRDHLEEARPHLYGRLTRGFVEPLVFCRPMAPRPLLAHIQRGLAGCRGAMQPLNAEAPADRRRLRAEQWVNLATLRATEDVDGALRATRSALRLVPDHAEALKQHGLLLANRRGDLSGAIATFRRLAEVVSHRPDQLAEVTGAIATLERLLAESSQAS